MKNDDDLDYSYKDKDYVPTPGNLQAPQRSFNTGKQGYYDLNKLSDTLDLILKNVDTIINNAEEDLKKYALQIPEGSRLAEAQAQEWPVEISETPANYITFHQYKSLEGANSRGAEYIRNVYDQYIQGAFGTNSVDLIDAASAIKSEALNIKDFLNDYIGDVNDSSEHRTLELLQDWAESGLQETKNLHEIFKERLQNPPTIPASELGQITEGDARSYQAFFQTKVNAFNREIKQLKTELKKEHKDSSEIFYKKFLGPSLKFRLDIGRTLEKRIGPSGFLSSQAEQANQAFSSNYVGLLTDQLKRNENFESKINNLTARIRVRDAYASFTQQVGKIVDTDLKTPFSKVDLTEEEVEGFESYKARIEEKNKTTAEFASSHSLLDGKDADDAHSQYLLKAGDTITGDILMVADAKLDGMKPSKHRHRGPHIDGTEQIHGEDIIDLVTGAIDRNQAVQVPQNLRHVSSQVVIGSNNVAMVNSLIAWECNPELTFEVQTVPIYKVDTEEIIEDWEVQNLFTPPVPAVAGIATNNNFFTYASATALYDYNYGDNTNTLLAGFEGVYGDEDGYGNAALFNGIKDLAQDFYGGEIYIVDESRKVKSTSVATATEHTAPVHVTTVYSSPYDIRRIDTQGQHYRNTAYVIEGPLPTGKDRVVKLTDIDNNQIAAGTTYTATVMTKLSNVYSNLLDIAVAANGNVFVLKSDAIIMYDAALDKIVTTKIAQTDALPVAITCDEKGQVFIAFA